MSSTARSGHTGGLGTERDVQVTDGDLGHGICVQILNHSHPIKV